MKFVQPDPLHAQSAAHSAATAPQATCGGAAAATTAGDTAADPATPTIPGQYQRDLTQEQIQQVRDAEQQAKLEAIGQKTDRLQRSDAASDDSRAQHQQLAAQTHKEQQLMWLLPAAQWPRPDF